MTDIETLRHDLLQASLGHVAFDGWSRTTLRAAARDLGVDPALAQNAFPGGEAELVEAFSTWADDRMLDALDKRNLPAMKVRDRITAGVRLRLELLEPHQEAVRRGLAFFALPQNGPLALKCLYRTVDAIWYAAGDRATDYTFYTKRLLLAGVTSSTLLVWLNDGSEGRADTWAFLERRIAEVLQVTGRLGKAVDGALDLPDRIARRFGPRPLRR
jgi:ubiquinone biosynthesis protein COQ9